MTFLSLRSRPRAALFALSAASFGALAVAAAACADDTIPDVYLGPAASSSFTPSPIFVPSEKDASPDGTPPGCEDAGAPALATSSLPAAICDFTLLRSAASVSSGSPLAVTSAGLLLSSGNNVSLYAASAAGCPTGPASEGSFGSEVGVVRAASSDVLVWLAGSTASGAFKASGEPVATCANTPATQIAADPSLATRAVAVNGTTSLVVLQLSGGSNGTECSPSTVTLTTTEPGPGVAIVASKTPGSFWVSTVESSSCGPRARVARYGVDGVIQGAAIVATSLGLCSADALVELGSRLVIADASCRKVVVVDPGDGSQPASVVASADAPGGLTPRALARGNNAGTRALVLGSAPSAAQTTLRLFSVPIP